MFFLVVQLLQGSDDVRRAQEAWRLQFDEEWEKLGPRASRARINFEGSFGDFIRPWDDLITHSTPPL